eukprot:2035815-Prymnesium_polylepis.1
MLRKIILTSAVCAIGEDAEQARVLVALLVAISFLTVRLSMKPLRRHGAKYFEADPQPSNHHCLVVLRSAQSSALQGG